MRSTLLFALMILSRPPPFGHDLISAEHDPDSGTVHKRYRFKIKRQQFISASFEFGINCLADLF